MKKSILLLVFIIIVQIGFTQESQKRLTEAEKIELRKKYGGIYYGSSNRKNKDTKELSFTNVIEAKPEAKTVKVKYYYGKTDSLYKEYTYVKP